MTLALPAGILIDDALWAEVAAVLPPAPPRNRRYAGRRPTPDRAALAGIVFVLSQGCAWNALPHELGFGSGTACWNRLRLWQACGAWPAIESRLAAGWRRRGQHGLAQAFAQGTASRDLLVGQVARSRNADFGGTIRLLIGFEGGLSQQVAQLLQQTIGRQLRAQVEIGALLRRGAGSPAFDPAPSRALTIVLGGAWLASQQAPANGGWGAQERPLIPIGPALSSPLAVVVAKDSRIADMDDLLHRMLQGGRRPTGATPGPATRAHAYLSRIQASTGARCHVRPCANGGEQVQALCSGAADFAVMSLVTAMTLQRSGSIRILVISSTHRTLCAPDVPVMKELGYPGLQASTWLGLFGFGDTSARLVRRIARETSLALRSPQALGFMHAAGATSTARRPGLFEQDAACRTPPSPRPDACADLPATSLRQPPAHLPR